jgi:colanic acid/amylovoran biosynthesis glycosyltransferase
MRIAFLVDQFPTLSETFILGQITGLIDLGHEVDIYCDRPGNITQTHSEVLEYKLLNRTYCTPIPTNVIWRWLKGIYLLLVNFWRSPQTLLQTLNFFKYERSRYGEMADFWKPLYLVIPFLQQPDYDIIHCHYGRNGLKAVLLQDLQVIKGKIVVVFHGNDISRYLQIHGDEVYNYIFAQADLLQPISQHWQNKLIALGCNSDKIAVHHMGINCDKFVPATAQKNSDQETLPEILIVSVARLVEKKGLTYGIEAVGRLIKKIPQLKLKYYIIGDGVLKPQLESQIQQLNLENTVELLGWRKQQEVQQLMSQADVMLASSITSKDGDCEGIPVSLMEAMAQEIPVISTYHSGIGELVADGISGYLVPEKEVVAITAKLEHLVTHPQLRRQMGQAGRKRVIEEYNIKLLCDRLTQIYQQLVQ